MPTAVITGCNSGIGHAWAEILIKEGYDVTATDITIGDKIKGLGCAHSQLDVASVDSIKAFAKSYGDKPLDLLLNIAGIMVPPDEDSLEKVTLDMLDKSFTINAYGPLLLTQALLPNILKAKGRVGIITSRVGSVGDNTSGGYIAYRSSKAAANQMFRTIAMDLKDKGIVVVLMHPGFVKSNLTESTWKMKESVFPDEAASKLWGVFQSKGIEETGRFWHREGQELIW